MKIYKARIGTTVQEGMAYDNWLIRARTFSEAAVKAAKTAARKEKNYLVPAGVDLVSLELLGEEDK